MAQAEAVIITFDQFQAHDNQNHTINQLMILHNATREAILAAMLRASVFVYNGRRAHGMNQPLRLRIHHPPANIHAPFNPPTEVTYNYENTFENVMGQIAVVVGLPFRQWVASYERYLLQDEDYLHNDSDQYYLHNDSDWHNATAYFRSLNAYIRRFTLTVHLLPQGVVFGGGGGGGA